MSWLISNPDSMVAINNVVMSVNVSGMLPTNVKYIVWDGKQGGVEYNDRMAVRYPLNNPIRPYGATLPISAYCSGTGNSSNPFNAWLHAAESASPAVNLYQAQQIKEDLVQDIYEFKRATPYTDSLGGLGKTWACDDVTILGMAAALASAAADANLAQLASDANTAIATLVSNIHTQTGTTNPSGTIYETSAAAGTVNWAVVEAIFAGGGSSVTNAYVNQIPSYENTIGSYNLYQLMSNISWTPMFVPGSAAPSAVSLTADQFYLILSAIVSNRLSCIKARNNFLASIWDASTVSGVIGVDPTTIGGSGWPF